jgi:hypothetical protein
MSDLDKRLLGLVIASPRACLSSAVAIGMMIGTELATRGRQDVVRRIERDKGVSDSVTQTILRQWASSAIAGDITSRQFRSLCDRIVALASAS